MKIAVAVLLIAVSLSGEENKRADVAQAKGNEKVQPAPTKENQQASAPNTSNTEERAPKWYASPEWWLVILGFPTLFFIGWQAWEMRKGGEVTNKQVGHLISAERAWLMDTLAWANPNPVLARHTNGSGHTSTSVEINLFWNNHGKTPAWVTEVQVRMLITETLPKEPDMTLATVLSGPYPVVPGKGELSDGHKFFLEAEGHPETEKITAIYGVIKYRDVFTPEGKIWETWFGYRIVPNRSMERLTSERYNRNT